MKVDQWVGELGVRVVEGALPDGVYGLYDDSRRVIFLESRLAPIQRRSTLAHELGPAYYGHSACKPRWELEAAVWASRLLIDDDAFMVAASMFDGAVAVANELGVLPRDVEIYAAWRRRKPADIVSRTCQLGSARTR